MSRLEISRVLENRELKKSELHSHPFAALVRIARGQIIIKKSPSFFFGVVLDSDLTTLTGSITCNWIIIRKERYSRLSVSGVREEIKGATRAKREN